ncbi:hypothetical protein [Burkholderia ubonensis]|uniref:hypothetical protein n=1 Tax=Burkholderia ubonensis TaxID=101571 RepID=UPI000A98706E|nr:hypothetical protein [Burkholderia ubonensis]
MTPTAPPKIDPRDWAGGKVGLARKPRKATTRKVQPARKFTQDEVNDAIERFLRRKA